MDEGLNSNSLPEQTSTESGFAAGLPEQTSAESGFAMGLPEQTGAENGFAAGLQEQTDWAYDLPEKDWTQYSPLTLAWIGDTVFDLVVRTVLVKRANMQTEKLHKKASSIVNARKQAESAEKILPLLTEEEAAIYRRGKNSSPHHNAKNAGRMQYLEATGFEALLGWLYLEKHYDRILLLVKAACEGAM